MDTVQMLSDFCKRYPVECTIDRVFNEPARIEFCHKLTGERCSTIIRDDTCFGISKMLLDVINVFNLKEDEDMYNFHAASAFENVGKALTDYNLMYRPKTPKERMLDKIKNVVFHDPATIVYWSDGTKTVVKAEGEAFDPEKGLAMACAKKLFGNEGCYYEVFKLWLPEERVDVTKEVLAELTKPDVVYLTPGQLAARIGYTADAIRVQCRKGMHPGAKKVDGKWMIPYEE